MGAYGYGAHRFNGDALLKMAGTASLHTERERAHRAGCSGRVGQVVPGIHDKAFSSLDKNSWILRSLTPQHCFAEMTYCKINLLKIQAAQ